MGVEIERKFLVLSDSFKKESHQIITIKQGFLNSNKNRTVRVRLADNKGFLTVKGISDKTGTSRFEWEKEITKTEAEQLLDLCEEGVIHKNRYLVNIKSHTYEVDEFFGANDGLIIAEVELKHKSEYFKKPSWLGKEVTGNIKYYNAVLSKKPYNSWKK